MAISGDYANPVTVNGYACRNCTEVDLAKKHIDPARPQDGPFGVNARDRAGHGPAVKLGGALRDRVNDDQPRNYPGQVGSLVSLSV